MAARRPGRAEAPARRLGRALFCESPGAGRPRDGTAWASSSRNPPNRPALIRIARRSPALTWSTSLKTTVTIAAVCFGTANSSGAQTLAPSPPDGAVQGVGPGGDNRSAGEGAVRDGTQGAANGAVSGALKGAVGGGVVGGPHGAAAGAAGGASTGASSGGTAGAAKGGLHGAARGQDAN